MVLGVETKLASVSFRHVVLHDISASAQRKVGGRSIVNPCSAEQLREAVRAIGSKIQHFEMLCWNLLRKSLPSKVVSPKEMVKVKTVWLVKIVLGSAQWC